MPDKKTHQEHPLANILINVLIPVMILSFCSKDPAIQEMLGKPLTLNTWFGEIPKFWYIGPLKAIIVALLLPLGYGIWIFVKTRRFNFFSGLGLFSVLLTGGLTLYLWNKDGTVKEHAGLLFGIKEGVIPLALGVAVLLSQRSATPLLNVFLYNDSLFDIPKIEGKVANNNAESGYRSLIRHATYLFASSFFISSVLNVALALFFFRGFDRSAPDALETYNAIIGRLTGWGFAVIGIPLLLFLFFTLQRILKGLRELTGLKDEELMLPR
jgi:hypothetical protein